MKHHPGSRLRIVMVFSTLVNLSAGAQYTKKIANLALLHYAILFFGVLLTFQVPLGSPTKFPSLTFAGFQILGASWPAASRIFSWSKREKPGNEVASRVASVMGPIIIIAREVSPGNRSNYKSTRESVDSKGLYGRRRLHLISSCCKTMESWKICNFVSEASESCLIFN